LRYQLKDKGLYHWPPHINLLYPFVVEAQIPEVTLEKSEKNEEKKNTARRSNACRDAAS
jgi:Zn/Cd-binding protein ZinT